MSINLMNTDRMSSVYYQSHTEPNIYFQPQFKTGAAARNTNPTALLNSRDESSEGNSDIQQRDTVKDTNEQLKKQMKKIKVLMIVAVSVIGAFLALAIGLAFIALIHSQKQLPLPDIDEEITKHVVPLQGNLTLLNNQLNNIYAKQLNELAQQVNESAEQTQTLNDISRMINYDLAEYAQQTRRIEDSVNQNRAIIEQMRNNDDSTNLPTIKTLYIGVWNHSSQILFRVQDPTTFAVLGFISHLSIPNTSNEYTSADNVIAYRPYYNDVHNSNLAILFFNLEAAFPCLGGMPICSLFPFEEDGFFRGRPLIQAADTGNHFRIFSGSHSVKTFGFGFAGCSTFANSCVPDSFELSLVCLLPRSVCTM